MKLLVWDYYGNLDTYPRTAYHGKEKAEDCGMRHTSI